jgi:hypothetical protein
MILKSTSHNGRNSWCAIMILTASPYGSAAFLCRITIFRSCINHYNGNFEINSEIIADNECFLCHSQCAGRCTSIVVYIFEFLNIYFFSSSGMPGMFAKNTVSRILQLRYCTFINVSKCLSN